MKAVSPASAPHRKLEAEDPHTPPHRLAELLGDESFWVRRAALRNPNHPLERVELLTRAGARPDLAGAAPLASVDLGLDPEGLDQLARDGGFARRLAAAHPNTDVATLGRLASDPEPAIRLLIAQHPRTLRESLAELVVDEDQATRAAAAGHPAAPRDFVELLDRTASQCPLSDADIERLLVLSPWTRKLLAAHPFAPPATLIDLSGHCDARIHAALAGNPATPTPALSRLPLDQLPPEVLALIAAHPNAPETTLPTLATHLDVRTRSAVAANPRTPIASLTVLLEDGSSEVRVAAAANPTTPPDAIARLVASGSTPDLLGFGPCSDEANAAELAALARGGLWARRLATRHPRTPPEALRHLAHDRDWIIQDLLERRGVASGQSPP